MAGRIRKQQSGEWSFVELLGGLGAAGGLWIASKDHLKTHCARHTAADCLTQTTSQIIGHFVLYGFAGLLVGGAVGVAAIPIWRAIRLHPSPASRQPSDRKRPTREPIPERVRHEVWRRDQGRCVDCGRRDRLEFDHIIPVSQGGSNTVRNIELRCESCNRGKGNRI